LVKLKEVQDLN
jgi:hypothetical protein